MCGRFTQYRSRQSYLEALGLETMADSQPLEPIDRYNVAPQSAVFIARMVERQVRFDRVRWGYAPFWAKGKRPPAINARGETAATSRFFKPGWKSGRCIVPADGWYEWVKHPDDPKQKQPFFIRLASGEPSFFAAIGQLPGPLDLEPREGDGFVIITADSDAGLLDIHDRRPVVLSPEAAANWMDPELDPEEARMMIAHHAVPSEAFEWWPVDRAVGSVRNQGAQLIERRADAREGW